jgi:hypothetical protein
MRRDVEFIYRRENPGGTPRASHRDYGFVAFLPTTLGGIDWIGTQRITKGNKSSDAQILGSLPYPNCKVRSIVAQESSSSTADVASWLS